MKGETTMFDGVVLVEFWAPRCSPCKKLMPIVEQVAAAAGMRLAGVNCDEMPEVAKAYGVTSVPTLYLFRGGEPTLLKERTYRSLMDELEPYL